jgi:hypothetical protein
MTLRVRSASLTEPFSYPQGVDVLAAPASLVTWKQGGSTVVLDTVDWERSPEDRQRGRRFLSAVLSNLGMPFQQKEAGVGDAVPNTRFATAGGQYNTADATRIELRSTGHAEAEFTCAQASSYELVLVASSTPTDGQYAIVRAEIDGKVVGEKVVGSGTDATYRIGPIQLSTGRHRLRLVFPNDASNEREDRNLVIRQVGFQKSS